MVNNNNQGNKKFNLKQFVQSDEYIAEKAKLQNELNQHSTLFNSGTRYPTGSNLIKNEPKTKRNITDTIQLKQAKAAYKKSLS